MTDVTMADYANYEEALAAFSTQAAAANAVLKAYIDAQDASTRAEAIAAVQALLAQVDNLDELESKLAALQALLGGDAASVLTDLQAAINALKDRATAVEGSVATITSDLEVFKAALDVWKTSTTDTLATLTTQVANMAGQVSELAARRYVSHQEVLALGNAINAAVVATFTVTP